MPDDFASLARDLAALPRADRQAVLAALDPDERRMVESAMRGAAPVRPEAEPAHSAWFQRLLESDQVTAAARAALVQATDPIPEPARMPGRTLLQAAGGLLAQARMRR